MGLLDRFGSNVAVYVSGENVYIGTAAENAVVVPAYVALHKESRTILACGAEAKGMAGKEPGNIEVVPVFQNGEPLDFGVAEKFLRFVFKRQLRTRLIPPRMIVSGQIERESAKRAFKELVMASGSRQVILLQSGMAAAIGLGLKVEEPDYKVALHLEKDWMVFSVISLASIVAQRFELLGWEDLLRDVVIYAREALNFEPEIRSLDSTLRTGGFNVASEPIGWEAWLDSFENGRETVVSLTPEVFARACTPTLMIIRDAYRQCLQSVPKDRRIQLNACGIHLSGEYSQTPGLDRLIGSRLDKEVIVKPNAERAAFDGTLRIIPDLNFLVSTVRTVPAEK